MIKILKNLIDHGNLYIKLSSNNTLITYTNLTGNVLLKFSAGILKFKGAKKGTPLAAQTVLRKMFEEFSNKHITSFTIFLNGKGPSREAILYLLKNISFKIIKLIENTPIAFNGCRKAKKRRI